ncbi:MAG: molybdopterin-guanine dinucleotide biosynthesis protein [Thermoleophilales bacterium]|nr:molybdopterin-guanine dinucleotide biosynthesis protein [Thermoleophilales bacterium]
MAEVAQLLEIEETVDIGAVLDLTRDVAHDVARPAAPLTTFALGLALGRLPDDQYEAKFTEFQNALTRLAAEQKES